MGRGRDAPTSVCTHHLLVALGLLGELGHVDIVGTRHDEWARKDGGDIRIMPAKVIDDENSLSLSNNATRSRHLR